MKKILITMLLFSVQSFSADFCSDLKTKSCLSAQKIGNYLKIDPVYFTDGAFKDQMIDQNLKRPVQFIPELETASSYFVSQFYNQRQFWIAEIPKSDVKDVVFQLALFKGPIGLTLAHAQYRFLMSKSIKLYRIKNNHIKTTATKDFIFTVQAALPVGESYNAKDAILGNYKIVARLANTYDRAINEEARSGDIVTQYKLKYLSAEHKNQLLKNSIQYSNDHLMNGNYVATSENCISIAFDILDKTLNKDMSRVTLTVENFLMNGKSPNEKMAVDALKERGQLDSSSRIENYTNIKSQKL
jgi:hypothetical protein